MANGLVDIFTSKEYKLLCYLSFAQVPSRDNRIIDSQEEISKGFQCSIATTNKLMKMLEKSECIIKYKAKSGYKITPRGYRVIEIINKLNQEDGGELNGRIKKRQPLANGGQAEK